MPTFKIRHMLADPVTCSYSPEKGGRVDVTEVEASSLEALVVELTGKGLYMQGHSQQGDEITVHDPDGGRWDCFKVSRA